LNNLKSRKIQKYDYAYTEQVCNDEEEKLDCEDFVESVRSQFFKFLKPFLCNINDCIDLMKEAKESERVFTKYFN
jgi:phenolic acid decarboxylase